MSIKKVNKKALSVFVRLVEVDSLVYFVYLKPELLYLKLAKREKAVGYILKTKVCKW